MITVGQVVELLKDRRATVDLNSYDSFFYHKNGSVEKLPKFNKFTYEELKNKLDSGTVIIGCLAYKSNNFITIHLLYLKSFKLYDFRHKIIPNNLNKLLKDCENWPFFLVVKSINTIDFKIFKTLNCVHSYKRENKIYMLFQITDANYKNELNKLKIMGAETLALEVYGHFDNSRGDFEEYMNNLLRVMPETKDTPFIDIPFIDTYFDSLEGNNYSLHYRVLNEGKS